LVGTNEKSTYPHTQSHILLNGAVMNPVAGMLFPVAALLFNCHTILSGNTMASCVPGAMDMLARSEMTLEDYLSF